MFFSEADSLEKEFKCVSKTISSSWQKIGYHWSAEAAFWIGETYLPNTWIAHWTFKNQNTLEKLSGLQIMVSDLKTDTHFQLHPLLKQEHCCHIRVWAVFI